MKTFVSLFFLGGLVLPLVAQADFSALFFEPKAGDFKVGDTFFVEVLANTKDADVNAVAAYMSYPSDALSVVSLDTAGSPFEFFFERNYGARVIEVAGGTPTPGFRGTYRIARVEFQAVAEGTATLEFAEGTAVMLDKGNTNIFQGDSSAVFRIGPANASKPEEPILAEPRFARMSPVETFLASLVSFLRGMF